jgi:hypothetical protein
MRKLLMMVSIALLFAIVLPLNTNAAPPDPDCDPLDPACPIDGGITLLIAAGIGLGAKRALKKPNQD